VRQIKFEVTDEWTPEVLYRIFEELRDNLDTGLIRNMEKYVSGWTVMCDNAQVKTIWRKVENIESDNHKIRAIVVYNKRTGVTEVILEATE
jgi:hypothetical protein